VQNTTEIASILGVITGTITLMLSAIAGLSLLVGGVGIMNIMLVSVTERTREIGIRMAVGARSRDILRQFLIEAILLSAIGGLIGVALGIGASAGLTMLINAFTRGTKWPVVVSLPAAAVALLFAAAVGMFFGYYPARRASRLDPDRRPPVRVAPGRSATIDGSSTHHRAPFPELTPSPTCPASRRRASSCTPTVVAVESVYNRELRPSRESRRESASS
jgi:hypothetical protein